MVTPSSPSCTCFHQFGKLVCSSRNLYHNLFNATLRATNETYIYLKQLVCLSVLGGIQQGKTRFHFPVRCLSLLPRISPCSRLQDSRDKPVKTLMASENKWIVSWEPLEASSSVFLVSFLNPLLQLSEVGNRLRGTQRQFSKNICSEDGLRSRIF